MEDFLQHHGRKGMKWYQTIFSDDKGSSGSSGKKKGSATKGMTDEELQKDVRRLSLEKQHKKLSTDTSGQEKLDSSKKLLDASANAANQTKNLLAKERKQSAPKINLEKMTDADLRNTINRYHLERQYSDIMASPKQVSRGKEFAMNALDVGGAVLGIGSSAIAIAVAIKELKK